MKPKKKSYSKDESVQEESSSDETECEIDYNEEMPRVW